MKLLFALCLSLASLAAPSPALASGGGEEKSATYEVPVPAELKEFATYQMDPVAVRVQGSRMRVRYELPLALTGAENDMQFEGIVGQTETRLSNPEYGGEMVCVAAENLCRVKYQKLRIDAERAESVLRSMGFAEEKVRGHLAVTTRIGNDMEGVIHFTPGSEGFRSYFAPAR